jgi:hypothetical protein
MEIERFQEASTGPYPESRLIQPTPTEHHGRVVNTPALYSGDPGFKSQSRRPAMLIEIFRGFIQSLQTIPGRVS